jgi:pimeloyl-ACP methyl ester carboxylesterase
MQQDHTRESWTEGLRIEACGEGDTILFVHADFVDGGMWKETMATLASRFRVACFDKRGYGRSEPATGPICRRRELETVVRAVAQGPVHLVGCSNGDQSALDLALEQPALVRSLTLVNATPSGFRPEGAPPPELLDMIAALGRGDGAAASALQIRIWFDGPTRDAASLASTKQVARAEAARMNRIFVDRGTYAIADATPKDPMVPPAIARLGQVQQPTLVVSGAIDYPENQRASHLLAKGIPGARLAVMEDSAHVPPLEAPQAFATLVRSFIE